jgi:hypothetical protein
MHASNDNLKACHEAFVMETITSMLTALAFYTDFLYRPASLEEWSAAFADQLNHRVRRTSAVACAALLTGRG